MFPKRIPKKDSENADTSVTPADEGGRLNVMHGGGLTANLHGAFVGGDVAVLVVDVAACEGIHRGAATWT